MSRIAPLPLVAAAFLVAGCLTHLPPPIDHRQMLVNWEPGYVAAQAEAQATGKPMLVVMAAGALDGAC